MRVHAVQTGTVAVRSSQREGRGPGPLRLLNTLRDERWTEPLPILAWVVEHPEGLIVVDTGETARTSQPGYLPRRHPYFRRGVREWVRPEDEIGPQVRALGLSPDDVRWVVLTHLHTDHAGGLEHFPAAEILVSRRELADASGLSGRLRGYLPHRWPDWFRPTPIDFDPEPYGPFPASRRLTTSGDVVLVPTPGHTPGHLSVVVELEEHLVLLAGDASYTEQLMLDGRADGVTSNPRRARATLADLRDLADRRPLVYLPSHDPGAPRRLETLQTTPTRHLATA